MKPRSEIGTCFVSYVIVKNIEDRAILTCCINRNDQVDTLRDLHGLHFPQGTCMSRSPDMGFSTMNGVRHFVDIRLRESRTLALVERL